MNEKDEARFSALWKLLAKEWAVFKENEGKREILELLCGALWHLQRASELGEISEAPLKTFHLDEEKPHWQVWAKEGKWFDPPKANFFPTIQSMLIADAALRLDGAREVIRCKSGLCDTAFENTVLPKKRGEIAKWLTTDGGGFKGDKPTSLRQVAIVTAFRDTYMHGEVTTGSLKNTQYAKFRDEQLRNYSLAKVKKCCVEVLCRYIKLVRCLGDRKKFCQLLEDISS